MCPLILPAPLTLHADRSVCTAALRRHGRSAQRPWKLSRLLGGFDDDLHVVTVAFGSDGWKQQLRWVIEHHRRCEWTLESFVSSVETPDLCILVARTEMRVTAVLLSACPPERPRATRSFGRFQTRPAPKGRWNARPAGDDGIR